MCARHAQDEIHSDTTKERDLNGQELDTIPMNLNRPALRI
jgi:hypothetical protein